MTISYFCIRMKYIHLPVLLIACLITACADEPGKPVTPTETVGSPDIPAGTIIATDTMPVVEDKLNNFVFYATITSTEKTAKGNYAIEAAWGHNIANSEFTMPKYDYPLIPVLKRTGEPYTYIVGFYMKDDTTFYDYYHIQATRGSIAMTYTKGYRFK